MPADAVRMVSKGQKAHVSKDSGSKALAQAVTTPQPAMTQRFLK
jgi:hypothetical protein